MEEKLEQFIIEVLADPVRTKVLLELLKQEGFPSDDLSEKSEEISQVQE